MRQDKWSTFPLPLSLSPPPPPTHLTTAGGVPLSLETLQGRQGEDKGEGDGKGEGGQKKVGGAEALLPGIFLAKTFFCPNC